MTDDKESKQLPSPGVTLRAVLLGTALIPINAYFIMSNHVIYWSMLGTNLSLIYSVVMILTILIAINLVLGRLSHRFVLSQGELLTVFVMLSVASTVGGHDTLQSIIPTIPSGSWYATPENEWKELFQNYLPDELTIDNLSPVKGFYKGESTFYESEHIYVWLRPILWWSIFMTAVMWVMVCLSVLIRKQWIDRERLSYPIIQLPLAMTSPKSNIFKSKVMWLGFAIAAGISLVNGLHVIQPVFPEIPIKQAQLTRAVFTEKPWTALGWVPFHILPFGVGLGFIMPLEMSFSLWFFYLFWKAEAVMGSAMGIRMHGNQQVMGSYLAIVFFALVGGRRHIYNIFKSVLKPQDYESQEPMKYRWAFIGALAGMVFLITFSYQMGMAIWVALIFFLVYYLLSISVGRIRAEVGPPTHELSDADPTAFLIGMFGTQRFNNNSLVMIALYRTFSHRSRSHPMPHVMEGFKLADESSIKSNRLVIAMMIAVVVGFVAAFWAYLDVAYRVGFAQNEMVKMSKRPYWALERWLYNPEQTEMTNIIFTEIGFLFTGLIWWIRRISPFFPFHHSGFAIAGITRTFRLVWFSVFISWLIKSISLKYGGVGLYRKIYPFFLGLIFGEYVVGGMWVLVRLLFGIEVYSFYG